MTFKVRMEGVAGTSVPLGVVRCSRVEMRRWRGPSLDDQPSRERYTAGRPAERRLRIPSHTPTDPESTVPGRARTGRLFRS